MSNTSLIVVIDDECFNVSMMKELLHDAGYMNVQTFTNPKELLKSINEGVRPSFIITDYRMPHMTGVQLLCEIERQVPRIPGIILTGESHLVDHTYPVVLKASPNFLAAILGYVESALAFGGSPDASGEP